MNRPQGIFPDPNDDRFAFPFNFNANLSQLTQTAQRNPVSSLTMQAPVVDYYNRLQNDMSYAERHINALKAEMEQLRMQRTQYEEALKKSNMELTKHTALNTRLLGMMDSIMNQLPPEVQEELKMQLEKLNNNFIEEEAPSIQAQQIDLIPRNVMQTHNISLNFPQELKVEPIPPLKKNNTKEEISNTSQPIIKEEESGEELSDEDYDEYDSDDVQQSKKRRTGDNLDKKGGRSGKSGDRSPDSEGGRGKNKKGKNKKATKDTSSNVGIPKVPKLLGTFRHSEVVCAVTFNHAGNRFYTGGRGTICLWDVRNFNKPVVDFQCHNNFLRSIKLTPSGNRLISCGETKTIQIWDVESPTPTLKDNLVSPSTACYSLACDDSLLFASCSNGSIGVWDLNTSKMVKTFTGHVDSVSSVEISPDGTKLVSGGLDGSMRIWDIGTGKEISQYRINYPIYSMSICPGESWVALGLENNSCEVFNLTNAICKYQLFVHEGPILSVKFAQSAKWFITCGKDRLMTGWRSPFGGSCFQCREPNSILCADISQDDSLIVTGSGDKLASLYQVSY